MKKILLCIICIMTVLTLTGCSKNAITTSDFKSTLESKGYSVSEYDDDQSISAFWAIKDDVIDIKFYEFASKQNTNKAFNAIEEEWNKESGNVVKTRISNTAGNFSTLSMTFDNKYKYICRVDKTLIRIDTDEDHKDEAKELIKELGY